MRRYFGCLSPLLLSASVPVIFDTFAACFDARQIMFSNVMFVMSFVVVRFVVLRGKGGGELPGGSY